MTAQPASEHTVEDSEHQQLADALTQSLELLGTLARSVTQMADINRTLHHRIDALERHLDLPTASIDTSRLDLTVLDVPGWERRLA